MILFAFVGFFAAFNRTLTIIRAITAAIAVLAINQNMQITLSSC